MIVEVSAALTTIDCGVKFTRVWRELDNYVGTIVENDRERVVERANDLADRMLRAQIGLAETLYKREWNENTAPMMSVLLPGTRSGRTTSCRFDHPDQHSNGPMSSLRMRMHSLGIQTEINGPNNWMLETGTTVPYKRELACRMAIRSLGKGECDRCPCECVRLAVSANATGNEIVQ